MEELFKQNLFRLRKPAIPQTFAEALMGTTYWAPSKLPAKKAEIPQNKIPQAEPKSAEAPDASIEGKKIEIMPPETSEGQTPTDNWNHLQKHSSLDDLLKKLSIPDEIKNLNIKNKRPSSVKVLFISEKFRSWEEVSPELKDGFINELLAAFVPKTAELFERMILAMKLTADEVIIYPVENEDKDLADEVMELAGYFCPEAIITLGAKATQKILKGQDRLSLIHGQFFTRKSDVIGNFNIVPLFHPSIIETNQNMKKTAWADMQKIMKHLKKLP